MQVDEICPAFCLLLAGSPFDDCTQAGCLLTERERDEGRSRALLMADVFSVMSWPQYRSCESGLSFFAVCQLLDQGEPGH